MSDKLRLGWVDLAKGISIILVVMMHSTYGVGVQTGDTGFMHWIIAFATPFRMPEFFLISGLFLVKVIDRDWVRYADRRVLHYIYFYALWTVLQIAYKVGLGTGDPLGALSQMGTAIVEPYGVLWFIYVLAMVSAAAKLLRTLRVPHWAALAGAAALQIAPVATGLYAIDQFAEYFVFFYAGYALAPHIFKFVDSAIKEPLHAIGFLALWAIGNAMLVFSPGFALTPGHVDLGYAGLPGLRLALAFIGTIALCTGAGLLTRVPYMDWLRWLGSHSIVIFLSFSIPMATLRVILLKLDIISNTGLLSLIVLLGSTIAPLVLFAIIEKTGWAKFLFERPAWAHIPGTPGSRTDTAKQPQVAAE